MLNRKMIIYLLVITVFATSALQGCSTAVEEGNEMSTADSLINADEEGQADVIKAEYKVERGTFEKREYAIGEVVYTDLEYETVSVTAEARVVKIKAAVGDKVKKGDVLITLEPYNDEVEIKRRTAEVEKMEKEYEAGLDSRTADITMAENELKSISDSNKRKIKKLEIKKLKLSLSTYKKTKKTVEEERKALDELINRSNTTKVTAKHDGYIVDMRGIQVDDTLTNGQTIAVVSQKKEFYIKANEVYSDDLRYGDTVDIVIEGREARGNVTLPGKVVSASNILNPRSNQFTAMVIPDMDTMPADDGNTFSLEDPIKVYYKSAYAENVLLIPVKAVLHEDDNTGEEDITYVYIKSGDDVRKQYISIVDKNKDYVRVESGVEEGDTLIVYNHS